MIRLPPTDALPPAVPSPRGNARRLARDRSVLVVVDIQARLAPHVLDHEALIARTETLVAVARTFGIPVLATEHCPGQIGPLVERVRTLLAPGEIHVKTRFGAADDAAFAASVARTGRRQVVLAGMEAHVCVMQTSLGLAALGYEVFVVADAVGSRAERQQDRSHALDRLRAAGCTTTGTETTLFEWTGAGDDPAFRDVLARLKRLP